jgi:hypothetical protein
MARSCVAALLLLATSCDNAQRLVNLNRRLSTYCNGVCPDLTTRLDQRIAEARLRLKQKVGCEETTAGTCVEGGSWLGSGSTTEYYAPSGELIYVVVGTCDGPLFFGWRPRPPCTDASKRDLCAEAAAMPPAS